MKKTIGLHDVDGHNFPNLALMKLSTHHKDKGDFVAFVEAGKHYDLVYRSKVFSFTNDDPINYESNLIIEGGTGFNSLETLPDEVEKLKPDYSIYPDCHFALGYITRGCPRKCPFCVVGEKEGYRSIRVAHLSDFWEGQKEIKLLDPNLLACKESSLILEEMRDSGAKIDFTQGLDVRFINEKTIELIKEINVKVIHFAYDSMKDKKEIERRLKLFSEKTGFIRNKVSVFVLVNYDTTLKEDLERIKFIRSLNFQPYVMVYNKHLLKRGKSIYYRLQRWVNLPQLFWGYESFIDYQRDCYKKIMDCYDE